MNMFTVNVRGAKKVQCQLETFSTAYCFCLFFLLAFFFFCL